MKSKNGILGVIFKQNKVQPLTFKYIKKNTGVEYLICWLGDIGINAVDISSDCEYSSLLIYSLETNDSRLFYTVSILTQQGLSLSEDILLKIKEEADKSRAIPVILLDSSVDQSQSLLIKALGIQIITFKQLEGLNRILNGTTLSNVDNNSTLLTNQIAYKIQLTLEKDKERSGGN